MVKKHGDFLLKDFSLGSEEKITVVVAVDLFFTWMNYRLVCPRF